jgi:PAS domain S-box-containing protein
MIALDMRTVILLCVISYLACTLFVAQLWRQNRKHFGGMAFWAFSFTLQTLALVLIALRGAIPDWMSIVLANTLVLGGAILLYIGLERFVGSIGTQIHNYLLLALHGVALVLFTHVQPDLQLRTLVASTALLIVCVQCLWLLWRRVGAAMRRMSTGVRMVLGAYGMISLARIVGYWVDAPKESDFFHLGAFQTLVLVAYQTVLILLTYSLVLMVNKRLITEISAEEKKFAAAFHSAPYAIVLSRFSDGMVVDANETFSSVTGYDRAEVLGKKAIGLDIWTHDEDRAAVVDALSKQGKAHGMELRFRKKSGERIVGLFSAEIILIDGEEIVLSGIGDITERKQAEAALSESEERFRSLTEMSSDFYWESDAEHRLKSRGSADKKLSKVAIFQKRAQIGERRWEIPYLSPDEAGWKAHRATLDAHLPFRHFELSRLAVDGTVRHISISGDPVFDASGEFTGYRGVGTDITERKQAEDSLEENREKYRGLSEGAFEAIFISEFGQCLEQNKRAEEMFGFSAEEALGRAGTQWFVPEDRDRVLKNMTAGYELPYEVTGLRKDGSTFPALVHGKMMHFKGRAVRVASISDISERKQAEAELVKRNAELETLNQKLKDTQVQLMQSEKLASIGQLAAGVAHEINNPIGYVHSNLGSLETYIEDVLAVLDAYECAETAIGDSSVHERLQQIKHDRDLAYLRQDLPTLLHQSKEGISRVRKIVQDLKDFSRADTAQAWEQADLHHCLDSTLSVVWNELKYKAEVIKEYGELPLVECVPSQLNQVFMNLMVNAAHAIDGPRGRITLRTGVAAENVWIEVKDTGTGIPAEIIGRIFDPFFTTKPVGKGTGLGLSLAYGIVQKHHGKAEVASEVGVGTTFRIVLPVKQPVAANAA